MIDVKCRLDTSQLAELKKKKYYLECRLTFHRPIPLTGFIGENNLVSVLAGYRLFSVIVFNYCVSCIFTANDSLHFFRILHSQSHIIPTYSTWSILHSLFTLLFFANSLINPVLYAFRIPEFRRALFSPCRCR